MRGSAQPPTTPVHTALQARGGSQEHRPRAQGRRRLINVWLTRLQASISTLTAVADAAVGDLDADVIRAHCGRTKNDKGSGERAASQLKVEEQWGGREAAAIGDHCGHSGTGSSRGLGKPSLRSQTPCQLPELNSSHTGGARSGTGPERRPAVPSSSVHPPHCQQASSSHRGGAQSGRGSARPRRREPQSPGSRRSPPPAAGGREAVSASDGCGCAGGWDLS